MKRLLPILLVAAVLGTAATFVFAPVFAFYALRSAAESRDVEGLAELVDYPAVRRSLQPQLVPARTPGPDVFEDPVGALKHAMEPFTAPGADAYLQPEALDGLTRGEGRAAVKAGVATTAAPAPRVRHWGPDRTRLGVPSDGGGETVFTFERRGLFKWKLVHLGLPEAAPEAAGDRG